MNSSRRTFITQAVAGGVASSMLWPLNRLAHAAEAAASDRYYIFCYFNGGWDVLLSLDPRDPRVFNQGNRNTSLIEPGYELLASGRDDIIVSDSMTFGPYIGDLQKHHDKMCVVRGMSMETLTHVTGRRRFLTGKPPSGNVARGSSAATWLAAHSGQGERIPNLAVRVESYNDALPNFASGLQVNSVADLVRALERQADTLPTSIRQQLDSFLASQAACPNALRSPMKRAAEGSRQRALNTVDAQLQDAFDFLADTPEMTAIRARYGIERRLAALSTPEAQAALAARAITSGISRCVSVQLATGLDTHFDEWAADQGPTQERGFNALAALTDDLASREYKGSGSSWLDHTTIVAFSEFSRTPLLNAKGGRDHSLTNSCLLLGNGIRGGRAVGASSDVGMTPQAINLSSGDIDPGGVVPRPEHVWQALFDDVGIGAAADLRVSALSAILSSNV